MIFYGGEPLMKLDKIKIFMDAIDAKFYIQSNGLFLKLIPEKYLHKIGKMLISIDGDRSRTDFNRGKGIYDRWKKTAPIPRCRRASADAVGE